VGDHGADVVLRNCSGRLSKKGDSDMRILCRAVAVWSLPARPSPVAALLYQAVLASIIPIALLFCVARADAGLIIGTYVHGVSNTVTDRLESLDFTPLSRTMTYDQSGASLAIIFTEASTRALKVHADVTDQSRGGFTEFTGQVVFEALPGSTATQATATLAVDIAGALEARGGANAGWSAILGFAGGSPTTLNGNNGGAAFVQVDETLSMTKTVPLNVPISFRVELRAGVFAPLATSHGIADFANSLTFNPNEFFTIHTPGVTVNSVGGDWLVNNRLPSAADAVPEPSSLALLGTGVLGLLGFRGWQRRRVGQGNC
jgi:hypothetical protein